MTNDSSTRSARTRPEPRPTPRYPAKPERPYVIIGHEKVGNVIYANAVACLRRRFEQGEYDYDPNVSGRREVARSILFSAWVPGLQEEKAWQFLEWNATYEYEGVERVEVVQ